MDFDECLGWLERIYAYWWQRLDLNQPLNPKWYNDMADIGCNLQWRVEENLYPSVFQRYHMWSALPAGNLRIGIRQAW